MFDWSDYLKLAEKLKTQSILREACLRSSVSRAYYAIYHIALDYAVSGKITPKFKPKKGGSEHRRLAKYYRKSGTCVNNRDVVQVGLSLGRIFNKRIECDYENIIRGNVSDLVELSFLEIEKILQFMSP